jgi:hypothetical protein
MGVDYPRYLAELRQRAAAQPGLRTREYGSVREGDRDYPLLAMEMEGGPELVITAGFHGEEPAGPLTLLAHLSDVIAKARQVGVALRIYPCINPAGFEAGTRYNPSGEKPNNDFLRYEVAPGEWVDTLRDHTNPLRHLVYEGGPKETRAIRAELEARPPPVAALDLHQDNYLPNAGTYAYVFGPRPRYAAFWDGLATPVLRSAPVDERTRTEADGLIEFHDGSVTDYFWRRGVPWAAALETTTCTPMLDCHRVNLAWILGFIGLAGDGRS